jgi:hypothetical protein
MSLGAVQSRSGVEGAIRQAAAATGIDFDFLMKTARRESSLNPSAKARTSSAAGLFQFVEQTWLSTLKRHGLKHGYERLASLVERGSDGRYRVDGADARRAVLNLRFDPQAASLMAGELASDHAAYLRGRTGREPTAGELYAAHFLGPHGSAKLIEAVERRPGAAASSLFPEAASANRSIFYRSGRAATVAEVYASLTKTGGGAPASQPRAEPAPEPTAEPLPADGFALARRMERLQRERALLDMVLGNGGGAGAGALFSAQLLGAFGVGETAE